MALCLRISSCSKLVLYAGKIPREFEPEDFFELADDLEPADILRFFGFGVISNVSNFPLFDT